ncbi:Hypothetical predicted protein [Mytilus galloprovincialis]|uniref:Ig-like domain-containing protein n=1 Tax=Mytilus galloprovincialis TaxID=29158 RepID=A0A8B6DIJ0_MYTGA|nr:Hypothetical predicted protein [Mytilus galloprovincialis]
MIHICIISAIIYTTKVSLNGPKYIIRDGNINVMCSSDEKPIFSTANFYINGQLYTSVRNYRSLCYSARKTCPVNSLTCYCSQDGKQYGLRIHAPKRNKTMTVSCAMQFVQKEQTFSKEDSFIVEIHDPPILKIEKPVTCNVSALVTVTCNATGNIGSFGDWIHSYGGKLIRTVQGKKSNNTSTIYIDNCDFEDIGEYTCNAWNRFGNETYRSKVTTRLRVYGPPKVLWIKSTEKHENPTIFSVSFYSPEIPTSVQWTQDFTSVDNFTGVVVRVLENNITFDMHGKPSVHIGHVTSLTVHKRSTSVYKVMLKNELGEYSHLFQIQAGRIYLNRFENAEHVSIYYAAPASVYNVSPYSATRLDYDEPINIPHAARSAQQRDNKESERGEREDDIETSHYIEIE